MSGRHGRYAVVAALITVVAGCAGSPLASPSAGVPTPGTTSTPDATASPTASADPTSSPTQTAAPSPSQPSTVVQPPDGLLPPGSTARVTADGLRLHNGPPGRPEHDEVLAALDVGEVVLVDWSPLAYIGPDQSPDGRPWYQVHVGGPFVMSYIGGGLNGWLAAGEDGLEYLELVPVTCPTEVDLPNLIYSPFTPGQDMETLATPWQRLACLGGRSVDLHGVYEIVCPEGGVYPFEFDPPFLAWPQWCTALAIDDVGPDGVLTYARGLPMRRDPQNPTGFERGDVLNVRGHFDDPLAASCTAEPPEGFEGMLVDPGFLVLFCREQFVPESIELVEHRDLAPLPWER